MVNVRSIVGSKDAPNQSGVRLPYFRNVGNARFFINDKNQDTVEQDSWVDGFSPPKVSKNGFIFGESALYEDELAKQFLNKLVRNARVPSNLLDDYLHIHYEGELAKILKHTCGSRIGTDSGPTWYFDQLVNDSGSEVFIAGDLNFANKPVSSDMVKIACSVGREKTLGFAEDLGFTKQLIQQFSINFNAVCFHLYAESMYDLSKTLDMDDCIIKADEIKRLGKMIDHAPLLAQCEHVVDFWLKDSPHKDDWKKLLL